MKTCPVCSLAECNCPTELTRLRAEKEELEKQLRHSVTPCQSAQAISDSVGHFQNEIYELIERNHELKQRVERAGKDFGIAAQQVLALKGKVRRSRNMRIVAMTCRATLKLILQDTQDGATATHLKPAIENLDEIILELKETP